MQWINDTVNTFGLPLYLDEEEKLHKTLNNQNKLHIR